jgi:CheY-like chemotaxis protein
MASHSPTAFEVLIVDDEPADVRLLKMAFAKGSYSCNVSTAGNGIEALSVLRSGIQTQGSKPIPDLVLLDLNMPQMNGQELLKAMKTDNSLCSIPVIIVSTSDAERDVSSSYLLGAAGYVAKPVDIDELFSAIQRIEDYWFGTMQRPHRR